jgi:hypothetical protein
MNDAFQPEDVVGRLPDDILKTLIGYEYDFYGVDNTTFRIGTSKSLVTLDAMEDPDDGYRSYFGCFRVSNVGVFFKTPISRVRLVDFDEDNFRGWGLIDVKDDHVWLRVGTDYNDDYYPCFIFDYQPKPVREDRTWKN